MNTGKKSKKAEELGVDPQEYVDKMAADVKKLWKTLDISYDKFIRTTDDYHKKAVQKIFQQLLTKEIFILASMKAGTLSLMKNTSQKRNWQKFIVMKDMWSVESTKRPRSELVKESSYFFRMSKYADRLVQYYDEHPEFIQPESRKNEMINNFIKPGLEDLAVSRTTFKWGFQ